MLRLLTLLISGPICILLMLAGFNWIGVTVNISLNPMLAGTLVGILSMLMALASSSLYEDLTDDQ